MPNPLNFFQLRSWLPGGPSDSKVNYQHDTSQYNSQPDDPLDNRIGHLCQIPEPQTSGTRPKIGDEVIVHIMTLLRCLDDRLKRPKRFYWSTRPRIYIVLRAVHALYALDSFIARGITDMDLPFDHQTLPNFLEDDRTRECFLDVQASVLAEDVRDLLQGVHKLLPDATAHFSSFQKLGDGAYGSVDAVYSRLSTRIYARKRIARGPDSDVNRCRQQILIQEIEHLKKCSHRHLVQIIGSYTDVKCIAYLMEPLAECNLYHYLTGQGSIPWGTIAYRATMRQFFGCLATAVDYLHREKKIRHRDLKPQNVLVDGEGRVYIGDFGAALDWSTTNQSTTRDRFVQMTQEYMSPEAARGSPKGSASDMWSLGLIFLDMITVLAGKSLSEFKRHLQKRATSSCEPFAYDNPASISEWLNLLQNSNLDATRDMEPLIWTKDLLKEKPDARPKSQALVRMIAEGPYSTDFCCVSCRDDFNRQSQLDDSPRGDLHFLPHSNPVPTPEIKMAVEKKEYIDQWRRELPHDCSAEPLLDYDAGYTMPGAWTMDTTQSSAASEALLPSGQQSAPKDLRLEELDPSNLFECCESMGSNLSQSQFDYAGDSVFTGELFQARNAPSSKNSDELSISSIADSPTALPAVEQSHDRPTSPLASILEDEDGERHQSNERLSVAIKPKHPTTTVENETVGKGQEPKWVKADQSSTQLLLQDSPSLSKEHEAPSRALRVPIVAENLCEDLRPSATMVRVKHDAQRDVILEKQNFNLFANPKELEKWNQVESESARYKKPLQPDEVVSSGFPAQDATLPQESEGNSSSDYVADRAGRKTSIHSDTPKPDPKISTPVQKEYFDAAEYIEAVWLRVEGAKSVATSVSSQKGRTTMHKNSLSSWWNNQYDVLEHSCKAGNARQVRMCLDERKCNPGTKRNPKPKPLLLAIKGGTEKHNKCVRALLEHGCDVNAKFRDRTPIHWLIDGPYFKGYKKLLAMLLSAGAKMNTADGSGDYPLLKLLAGASDESLEEYKTVALALILNKCVPTEVDVNVKQPISQNTALHLAVQRRASAAVGMLILHGADVNATTASGTTPLIMAASQWHNALTNEQSEVLQRLLAASEIEIDVVGGSLSRTALHQAVASGCKEAVQLLVDKNASLSYCDKNGHDALALLQESVTPHLEAPRRRMLRDILERKL